MHKQFRRHQSMDNTRSCHVLHISLDHFSCLTHLLDSVFRLRHRFVCKVKLVGFIIALKMKERYTLYTLDDSTGSVLCKEWKPRQSSPSQKTKVWRLGDWVSVEGKLNYFRGNIEVDVESIDEIRDPNCTGSRRHNRVPSNDPTVIFAHPKHPRHNTMH